MSPFTRWWRSEPDPGVKLVFLVLLANALPAITVLMTFPDRTDVLFVWTVQPELNARLLGVMYANALLLVGIGALQPSWPRVRIVLVVVTLFSILATALTFVYLKPFLSHPWYHLTYWLTMYLILVVVAPIVFVSRERRHGGRLPVTVPLGGFARAVAGTSLLITLATGLGLLFRVDIVNSVWPWTMPPLVGGLIGVLFVTHAAAYAWALWDGDWLRVRPMFWQAAPTALLFALLPLVHPGDLRPDAATDLTLYLALNGVVFVAYLAVLWGRRSAVAAHRNRG
jgi:hypothetical protein